LPASKHIFGQCSFRRAFQALSSLHSTGKRRGAYIDLMVYATARAILSKAKSNYESVVIVDGLRQKETRHFAHGLRSLHVAVEKVRGMKDESNSLIRLADAIAGFMRDYLEGQPYATELAKSFRVEKIVKELG
jgi:hypothetical protein